MKNYFEMLDKTIKEYFKILSDEIPDFLNEYINTKEIYNTENSENILVQGIIDLYYINQNDELILVDYKTDYTQDEGKDLVDKYKVQLEIYKKALEEALKIPVKETYIYSIYANKAINLEKR